jgi:hypothetical protein
MSLDHDAVIASLIELRRSGRLNVITAIRRPATSWAWTNRSSYGVFHQFWLVVSVMARE